MPNDLQNQINTLKAEIELLKSEHTIPFDIENAFRNRLNIAVPEGFDSAPVASITAPTGGATQDTVARTAINSIISALEELGLLQPN